jgi:hypothetical protein
LIRLIATLGKSPGGVAETIRNLSEGNYLSPYQPKAINLGGVIVVRTREVEETFKVLKSIVLCCLGRELKLKEVVLPFNDVEEIEHFRLVREKVRDIVRVGDYLDFSGGRKAISSAAVIAARENGAHLVTTIIPQKVQREIEEIYEEVKERAINIYESYHCFEDLCKLISPYSRTLVLI